MGVKVVGYRYPEVISQSHLDSTFTSHFEMQPDSANALSVYFIVNIHLGFTHFPFHKLDDFDPNHI